MSRIGTAHPNRDSTISFKRAKDAQQFGLEYSPARRGFRTIPQSPHVSVAELHLLFAPGKRPDRDAVHAFIVQHRGLHLGDATRSAGLDDSGAPEAVLWAELLRDGLTFDLHGLAPGPACTPPVIEHRFDQPAASDAVGYEAMRLQPGPHLVTATPSMPVMRALLTLSRDLTRHFAQLVAVSWSPARSVIGRRFFESVITAWLEGGPFPALGLIAFAPADDGALQSVGLQCWIGQELRIEAPLSHDRIAATRLGVRLVNQLLIVGGLDASERVIAPDGTRLIMQTSRNSEFVRVRRE